MQTIGLARRAPAKNQRKNDKEQWQTLHFRSLPVTRVPKRAPHALLNNSERFPVHWYGDSVGFCVLRVAMILIGIHLFHMKIAEQDV